MVGHGQVDQFDSIEWQKDPFDDTNISITGLAVCCSVGSLSRQSNSDRKKLTVSRQFYQDILPIVTIFSTCFQAKSDL